MTPRDAAKWLMVEVGGRGALTHEDARYRLAEADPSLVKLNADGHLIIKSPVLKHFRKMRGDTILWCCVGERWRLRQPDDPAGANAVWE
jgi:hypothetical protein